MSNISFNCPECNTPVEMPVQSAGQQAACPHCAEEIAVPALQTVVPKLAPKPQVTFASAPRPQATFASAPVAKAPVPVVPAAIPAAPKSAPNPTAIPTPVPQAVNPQVTFASAPTAMPSPAISPEELEARAKARAASVAKLKKVLIFIGIIVVAVILTVAGWWGYDWYQKSYLPEQNRKALHELKEQVSHLSSFDEKIALLKKSLADAPDANKADIESMIRKNEEGKQQELLRRQQEKEKQEELKRQKLVRQQNDARRKEFENKFQEKQQQEKILSDSSFEIFTKALTDERSEHIFITSNYKTPVKYSLFRYDPAFAENLHRLQKIKAKKVHYNLNLKTLTSFYFNGDAPEKYNFSDITAAKEDSAQADRILPELAAKLAVHGKHLIIDADSGFFSGDRVFLNIPAGEWLLVGVSEAGEIFFCNIVKRKQLPIFIEFKADGLQDISSSRYNDQERELEKKFQVVPAKTDRPVKTDRPAQTAAAVSVSGENTPERLIPGLVFFAELRKDLKAFGGSCRGNPRNVRFKTVDQVQAINFPGDPSQGITYQWNAISGSRPRSVSVWFYCDGYNRHDGGNAILSYGIKDFKKYFDIETNRSRNLGWAWDTNEVPLARNIKNNQWNHFAITYDGKERICYLNGKVSAHFKNDVLNTSATPLMIGTRLNDSNHCFVGSIRNVAIYDRALNSDEIKLLSRSNLKSGK